jgi:hypothetical protein
MNGFGLPKIWMRRRSAVNLIFQVRRQGVIVGLIRPWNARRGHGFGPKFSNYLFPGFCPRRYIAQIGNGHR